MKTYLTAIGLCFALTLGVFVYLNMIPKNSSQRTAESPVLSSAAAGSLPTHADSSSTSTSVTEPSQGNFDYSTATTGLTDPALNLASFQGKPTLVYVFLATCPHCRAFYPNLELLARKYAPQGLQTVMLCGTRSTALEIEDFKNTLNPSLPMLKDVDKEFQQKYNITMIPTVFLVNAAGHFQRIDYNQLNSLDSALGAFVSK